jgi:hypothetical protein
MSLRYVSLGVWVFVGLTHLPSAYAQATTHAERPAATVLRSQLTGVGAGEGAAFDRTVRARLDALGVVRTEGAVALDLEETQLAIGCMGETVECLTPIAESQHTPVLVIPSLAQAGSAVVATVLVFDQRDGSIRRGTRQGSASDATGLLAGVDGLLREVFGLPPADPHDAAHTPPDGAPTPATPAPGLAPLPLVLIGVGAAALIAGAIAGGLSIGDASTIQNASPMTTGDVDALASTVSRQNLEATLGDAMLIGGGVVLAAGVIWELAGGREDGSSPLAVAPMVSPTQVGLVVSGTFGGDL